MKPLLIIKLERRSYELPNELSGSKFPVYPTTGTIPRPAAYDEG